ncbi:probable gpi8-gpi-anchor transamidase [Ceraceosorus bombacis]|uniref:Probable gpi8-gpi-anchor transamidase n=1 Tax=Ceraceosorus bombacis TaxID=401625 RepID=A0A0P1BH26_9BASI|nr:probable gpi8-gpi-anchor transamidase [Ceraceosorus bombacis]
MAIEVNGAASAGAKGRSGRRWHSRVLLLRTSAILASLILACLVAIALPLTFPGLFVSAQQTAQLEAFFARNHHQQQQNGQASLDVPVTANGSAARLADDAGHTNNWAVLVSASKFWFNYRHMANTLGMYRTVKRLGIPDSHIILMLADDAACNSRNLSPGYVWAEPGRSLDLYGQNVEVDYRGYEVTVEAVLRLLTGRVPLNTPRSKRLESDSRSNVFLYMTGHGGDEFLKFQDYEEISAFDLADAIEQMWEKKRYHELFFMIDTCQANTMYSKIYSPNVIATGSSKKDQNSYSHGTDEELAIAMSDRFTLEILDYMESVNKTSSRSLQDLFDSYDPERIHSDPGVRRDLWDEERRPLNQVKITDFLGGVSQVEVTPAPGSDAWEEEPLM